MSKFTSTCLANGTEAQPDSEYYEPKESGRKKDMGSPANCCLETGGCVNAARTIDDASDALKAAEANTTAPTAPTAATTVGRRGRQSSATAATAETLGDNC